MKQIRLVNMGSADATVISNLSSTLNSLQSEFRFSFDATDTIRFQNETRPSRKIDSDQVETLLQRYIDSKSIKDYTLGICDYPFKDQIVTSSDDQKAIISSKGWDIDFSKYSILKVITFGLIDIIFESLGIATPTHYESESCPMDLLLAKKNVLLDGVRAADLCKNCRKLILEQVSIGKVSIQQLAAIYKLLDFIAGRKICFVLMPFGGEFDSIYKHCIQAAMTELSWLCARADEIHKASEVIDQIWENILRADLVIADLTGRNPNVFYELGYAHALNKNTILLTQSIEDVPFDLKHRRLVSYLPTSAGYQKLKNEIGKYVM